VGLNRRIATYLLLLFTLPAAVYAQPDSLHADTVRSDTLQSDSTATVPADTLAAVQADTAEPGIEIVPWIYAAGFDSRKVSGDSLLRWQNWPNWTYKKNRDPGVITYRLGTVGRSSAMMIDAQEPRYQDLYWEDIRMNDPVSGTVNWNVLPLHKLNNVYEDGTGIDHQTHFTLKQYYVNKPLTKLIFDESKFDRRALEFWLTQNFSQKTNIELSYWDRRGGGGYPNSSYSGSQIFGRLYHHFDNRQLVKLRFLTSSNTLGVPFGYEIPDLNTFSFNRFVATPFESSAESRTGLTTLALSYHRRSEDTLAVAENLRGGLFLKSRKRSVDYSVDSTYYKVQSFGAFLHKWIEIKPLELEARASVERFSNQDTGRSSLAKSGWNHLSGEGSAVIRPIGWWRLTGQASADYRDGELGYSMGAGTRFDPWGRIALSAGVSIGERLPTLQQLYWDSREFSGSGSLVPERIEEAHGRLEIDILRQLRAGVTGQAKRIRDAILLDDDSTFANAADYNSLSATAYADYSGRHFELSASATIHRYQDFVPTPNASGVPDFTSERIWMKGSAYWKGYLFDRATYVKAGVAGMFAPKRYLADHYETALDFWQPASSDQLLPWFSRLDVDISARVRTIMFVVRFENVLDQVNQFGYFETANYPMPPRRFIFGVRAIFNN